MTTKTTASPTLGDVIAHNRGFTSGFDYLRIALAIAIVLWHGILLTAGSDTDIWAGPLRPIPAIILPMFFCLSGFLVAGSLFRTSGTGEFLLLRVLRIVPALAVEVLLSALILGPMLTGVSLGEYFTGTSFYTYFLNIIGYIHYELPGVFTHNPFPGIVNGNLWTLPHELECYVLLTGIVLAGLIKRPWLVLVLGLALIVVSTGIVLPVAEIKQSWRPTGKALILSFLFGVILYLYRDKVRHSRALFVLALIMTTALLFKAITQFVAVPFIAYVTVYIGLLNPPRRSYLLRGDYSYGLYLFGFPLQQAYSHLWPDNPTWLGCVSFGLFFGLIYAWFSWNYVEKPILKQKAAIIDGITARAAGVSTRLRRSAAVKASAQAPSAE